MRPFAAQLAIQYPAHERRIFARHSGLITIPVQRPSLHLPLVQLTVMKRVMKRMLVMIPLGTHSTDRRFKLSARHERIGFQRNMFIHSRTSIPS